MPPTALIQSIDAVRRRARVLSIAYGVGVVAASAIGLLVAVVLIDYLLNLRSLPRVVVMLLSIGTLGYLAYRYIARPAIAALTLSDVAGRLEKAFPQFEDRLRSTVNFVESENPGSDVLQQRVILQATEMARSVDLSSAVVAKPAMVSMGSAAGAFVLMLALTFGLLSPGVRSIITSRLLTPFSAMPWPKNVQINLRSTIPPRVPVGQKIDVRMTLDRGDKPSLKPILYYQIEGGPRQQVFMTRGADGQFQASLDARLEQAQQQGKLIAWIEAGDDIKHLESIAIVPRLSIKQITASITPPAYVPNKQPTTADLATSPAVMPEGSQVAISIRFNKPLSTTDPVLRPVGEVKLPDVKWSRSANEVAVASFAADKPSRFRVEAVDTDGFTNTALEEYELIVRPDANLSLQLENPRKSEERTATSFVPLQAVAEDDCGVDWVTLVVERMQPSPQKWEIPLVKSASAEKNVAWQPVESSPERTRNRLNYQWELSHLKLSAGDVVEYHLLARDNFDLNGRRHEPVASSRLRISIISQEDLTARVADEVRAARTQAGLIRQTQQRTQQETRELNEETKDKPELDAADRAAATRISQQQSATAASTKQLSGKMQSSLDRLNENRSPSEDLKNLANEVKDTLDRTSEGDMKNAAQDINTAGEPRTEQDKREEKLNQADKNQQQALSALDRAMSRMDAVGNLQASIAELSAILNEQKDIRKANEEFGKANLGKRPEQMDKPTRDKLDDIAKKQDKLSERTEALIDKLNKQGDQMKTSDPSGADAMKQAAQSGQQSKVPQNQKKAAQQTSQNQQSTAQSTQQQVELGLEQMLGSLKDAEKRELAKLREDLAKMQEQVANLIRRQSGHNLDNLLLQGPEKLKAVDAKVVADLTERSKRQADQIKPPELRLMSQGQELTEKNARDLGRTAESKPATAEIASRLTKAAGKMERAIVHLRAGKVAEAYEPPQVEALAALDEAKKLVDEQKNQADNKDKEQQKEAIRARYQKIKDAQDKINASTTLVEKSRDAQGAIPRQHWGTIGNLPKDQTANAEETATIDKDLESLGSIIYVWANRDIRNSMEQVKGQLADQKTGVPTQAEQTRIVEQLDAMIKHLSEKEPPPKKFEEANNGGGGGGQGGGQPKKMPTEAELKLLKALQQAVNTSTTKIDAQPNKDKEILGSLGGRQGELRNLLDALLKKASNGQIDIGPEPDNKDQLPEEATAEDVDQKELDDLLLGDNKTQEKIEKDFKLVGTRMGRSRQRLALSSDPGKVTQEIQKRILIDLDGLIDEARKNAQQQQQQASSSSSQQGKPDPNQGKQPDNQGKNEQASAPSKGDPENVNNNSAGAGSKPHDLRELQEAASEWGALSKRERDAVIESKGEAIVDQYKKLIEDYYRALSDKSRNQPQP